MKCPICNKEVEFLTVVIDHPEYEDGEYCTACNPDNEWECICHYWNVGTVCTNCGALKGEYL